MRLIRICQLFVICAIVAMNFTSAFAAEKPEIFVQLAKESTIYFSGLKFMQEVQT